MGYVSQESHQHVDESATTGTSSSADDNENNEQQPFHHADTCNFINLDIYIKILFILNGLVQVIPNLALMALINDRIKYPA